MSRVLDSLLLDHDPRLVLLAAVICALGAVTTMSVSGRAVGSPRSGRWLVLLSVCAGLTVWATHFIAMLAYRQSVATTYDPGLTALSFVAGSVVMGLGLGWAIRAREVVEARLLGGTVLGLGVVILHYLGMAALRMPGGFSFEPGLVVTSVVLSLGFGAGSLAAAFRPSRPHRFAGALLMVVMIVSLHFTAMGAVHVHQGMADGFAAAGVTRPALATAVAVASISMLLIGMGGALIDQRVSQRLAAEAERFRTLADGAFEGLIVHQGGAVVDANPAARRLFGLGDGDANDMIAPWLAEIGSARPTSDEPVVDEVTLPRRDGTTFPAEVCRRRIQLSGGGHGELCAIRDVTARKDSEARIAHLALHDPLTDLPNRRFFAEIANRAIAKAIRSREAFALMVVDLDDFKQVNDLLGHAAGDELLRVTARRIQGTLRETDTAARFGGDEFAVLAADVSDAEQTMALAERLVAALREPVPLEYGEVSLTCSIGIAHCPGDGAELETLLRNADTAMYRAKADGKSMVHFFEHRMDEALVARRRLERRLRVAVREERLSVAYQPIVESGSHRLLGLEALVRWSDPELGDVPPSRFIPVAEATGLIVPMAELVLRQACRDARSWPDDVRVAVNLSAVQFRRGGLVETVQRALEESGLAGERLELEVTETLLMDNRQEALRLLTELKGMGIRISMDDFGTGYSALGYLQSFPFDKIKIDRVFVTDLVSNPQNAAIVRAVVAMGRSLGMRVVAEGVETDCEAEMLRGLDCDEIQGYLIARPMAACEIQAFVGSRERTAPRPVEACA